MTNQQIYFQSPITSLWLTPKPKPKAELIIKKVADYFQIPVDKLTGKTRKRAIVQPRMVAIYLLRMNTDLTLKEIGGHFEGDIPGGVKDHTTVVHSFETLKDLMHVDPSIHNQVQYLQSLIK